MASHLRVRLFWSVSLDFPGVRGVFFVVFEQFFSSECGDYFAEMQKAASMASVLVLIFPPAVLFFEHPAQIVIN